MSDEEIQQPDDGQVEEIVEDIEDQEDLDSLDDDQIEPESDSEEVEFNGAKYNLPKQIAEGVKSMRADYTQKTMTLAEQRKAFEKEIETSNAIFNDLASVRAIDDQLSEYQKVNWRQLSEEDPVLWQKLFTERQLLIDKKTDMVNTVTQKKQQVQNEMQQAFAKQVEQSEAELRRDIKQWSPELEIKMQQFAVSHYGFDLDAVKRSKADPRLYKLLHDAFVGSELIAKAKEKPKPDIRPVTSIAGKSSKVVKNPSNMSAAEYIKWRKAN